MFHHIETSKLVLSVTQLTGFYMMGILVVVNPSRPDSGREGKINLNYLILSFTFLCSASNGFKKTFKAFIQPFEAPQRSVKIRIKVIFYFHGAGRING